jgi:hypothetical protein
MGSLKAAISAARLLATSTGLSLKATARTFALKAEVAVGLFLRFLFLSDTANLSDTQDLDVSKILSESPSASDDDTLSVTKSETDAAAFTDDDILAALKRLSEAPGASDNDTLAITKPLSDNGAVAESASLQPTKAFSDSAGLQDDDTLDVTKVAGDDTAYDYCDISYFGEDYVEGARIERIFVAEDNVFDITKLLTDQAVATDDLDGEATAEDDQEIQFVKTRTDLASITDVFDRVVVFVRDFSEAPAANDDQSLTIGKGLSESPSATESHTKAVGFNKADAGTVSDADVLSTGKNLGDNGGIIDSQVVQFTKASSDSGVASDSGNLRSQGYCDFTYFAEDYVGASRTF